MAFTAQDVKALREKTGVGMMECKKALTEANGDMDKAIDFLRERGLAAAQKKAARIAAEGVVLSYADAEAKKGVVIEVNSETDFVAKNEKFVNFVTDCTGDLVLFIGDGGAFPKVTQGQSGQNHLGGNPLLGAFRRQARQLVAGLFLVGLGQDLL